MSKQHKSWLETAREKGLIASETGVNSDNVSGLRILPPLPDCSESEFQVAVIQLAQSLGYRVSHFRRVRVQRGNGQTYWETPVAADGAGMPDLILVRESVIWAELKTDSGQLTPDQKLWIESLIAAGQKVFIWKPKMWKEILDLLK